jgi:hypothetical protein
MLLASSWVGLLLYLSIRIVWLPLWVSLYVTT